MLLLHGLLGDASNWQPVVDYFSSDFRVIVPEIPVYRGKKGTYGPNGFISLCRRIRRTI